MSGQTHTLGFAARDDAMTWLILLRESPDNADLARAHRAWLAKDEGNARAWCDLCDTWAVLGAVAPPAPLVAASPKRRPLPLMIALAATVVLAVFLGPEYWRRAQADYWTGTGETQMIALADGSQMTLGAQTAVQVTLTDARREIYLMGGSAYFEVAPDPARPFSVHADGVAATAIGTAFEVTEVAGTNSVAVAEGVVAISGEDLDAEAPPMAAGDWMRRADTGVMARGTGDPSMVASWRNGLLLVEDQPVSDVTSRLARHSGGHILLVGVGSDRHVTGVFNLAQPDDALETLAQSLGVAFRKVGPLRILSSY